MGAKTWMLVYSDGNARAALRSLPAIDRAQSVALASRLFPDERLRALADGSLAETATADDEIVVGCFPGVAVVATIDVALDRPSQLPAHFLAAGVGKTIQLHAMHSAVDWFAYAVWSAGELRRSLSLSPDDGVIEDLGERLPFEAAYWAGAHPALGPEADPADYPFAFDPLELGEAALAALFGYQLEGQPDPTCFDPEQLPLMRFQRSKKLSLLRRWLGRR